MSFVLSRPLQVGARSREICTCYISLELFYLQNMSGQDYLNLKQTFNVTMSKPRITTSIQKTTPTYLPDLEVTSKHVKEKCVREISPRT